MILRALRSLGSSRTVSILLLALGVAVPAAAQQREGPTYGTRPEVRDFIEQMVQTHGFEREWLETAFARARFQAPIVKAMEPLPTGKRSWEAYRSRFVNARNVEEGLQFWRDNRIALARAGATYGVPPEIIVAIVGIETRYGRNTGNWRIIDALSTLAFDYPRRAAFFRSELEQFLLVAREWRTDPVATRGSFAGAMGLPQFMPGSYRRFAVDFDGDGRRDLMTSPTDAIGSVGNFLREHGWISGEPTAYPAKVDGDEHRLLLQAGIRPVVSAGVLQDYGVKPLQDIAARTPVALVELDTPDRPSAYYVGLANFYAITRYNQSSFYAISVIELANALRAAFDAERAPIAR